MVTEATPNSRAKHRATSRLVLLPMSRVDLDMYAFKVTSKFTEIYAVFHTVTFDEYENKNNVVRKEPA